MDEGYLRNQTIEQRYLQICDAIERLSAGMSKKSLPEIVNIRDRFLNYIENGWVSFASPVLSNFGHHQNLPISCNYGTIPDDMYDILNCHTEVGMLSKYGAGVAMNFSQLRPAGSSITTGGKSEGVMAFIAHYEDLIKKVSQNGVRRGSMAAYLSVDHPEIMDFLNIGTDGYPINLIQNAVTIPKGWMQRLKDGDSKCRKVWSKILKNRAEIGYPYILFEENCNNENSPQVYRDKGFWIASSNLCSEVLGYYDDETTFACCLSSVVLPYYDAWKDDKQFIFDMNIMLDCVLEDYIQRGAKLKGLGRALKFANEHRTIGLGVLGFHTYLQRKSVALGSLESFAINNEIFKKIREESDEASRWMAKNWGEPEYMKGTGFRNGSRIAVAPTKSTSEIAGDFSMSIEPNKSNINMKKLAKGMRIYKNPELVPVLEKYKKNTKSTWDSILDNNGSVLHLDFLSEHEKNVFKTFPEVSQADLISLAAQRQKYIDQGQSLNLMFHPKTPPKEINKLMLEAYDKGIKTLYYQYSISAAQEFNKNILTCSVCEG
jgi:ribonucleoside-diphosphate reductase alpha chain